MAAALAVLLGATKVSGRVSLSAFQMRPFPSFPIVTNSLPFGLRDAAVVEVLIGNWRTVPVVVCHRRAVPSWLPVATNLLSGLKAALQMPVLCPLRTSNSLPVLAPQVRAV